MTDTESSAPPWVKIGLIVTGKLETLHLQTCFQRNLCQAGARCSFRLIRRGPQLAAPTSEKKRLRIKKNAPGDGVSSQLADIDEEIALQARRDLHSDPNLSILWVDDIEHDRRHNAVAQYDRLRNAVDEILPESMRPRAGIHFFVNMLEAYYFADARIINAMFGTSVANCTGDCEDIRHPKGELDAIQRAAQIRVKELDRGRELLRKVDFASVLGDPNKCRALRTLVAWCWERAGNPRDEAFCLVNGVYWTVTAGQLQEPPRDEQLGDLNRMDTPL